MARPRGPLKLWICTICSMSLIISHLAPQFSCQTPTPTSASENEDELARSTTGCNHRASHESMHEAYPARQASNHRRRTMAQPPQQQQFKKRRLEAPGRQDADNQHFQMHAGHTRQQRQYNQQQQHSNAARSAAMLMGNSQQALDGANAPAQNLAPPLAAQPEEFSLAAGSQQNSQASADLQQSASSTQLSLALAPAQQQNLTGNAYTLLGESHEQPVSPTPAAAAAAAPTTTNKPTSTAASDRELGSEPRPTSGSLAPPTSTEQAATQAASTTPQLANDSLSPPVAPQPPVTSTTSSSVVGGPSNRAQQQQSAVRQQQGRRMEDDSHPAAERHASGAHPISSSPSSVSIITPLMGPPPLQQPATIQPTQQQQQQESTSSMMKPIYVVGNPIGEMDYTSVNYEQQNKALNRAPNSAGSRAEKRVEEPPQDLAAANFQQQQQQLEQQASNQPAQVLNATLFNGDPMSLAGERMNGPALVYSDGRLVGVGQADAGSVQAANTSQPQAQPGAVLSNEAQLANHPQQQKPVSVAPAEPRLFQGAAQANGAAVLNNNPRRPSLPPPVNQEKAASGFRSPLSPSGPLIGQPVSAGAGQPPSSSSLLQQPANSQLMPQMNSFYQASPPYGGSAAQLFAANMANQQRQAQLQQQDSLMTNKQAFVLASQQQQQQQQASQGAQFQLMQQAQLPPQASISQQLQQAGQVALAGSNATNYQSRRPLNITRVEHISAECSNDLIRAVIVFNGTFKGIIYSSGYVNDPTCLYVNGSGSTRYEFSIRLNQCGTLGRQEMHQPAMPGEAKRRDQVMWNTLSIQYNSVIEQEWDEHFRVSCEYGSDFWKTISFSPFNVETNTGSPVVFTINPPQCQMDVLLGHGMGPKIAVDGPVTVGDPLTLLIHMKSEKAGYDILVKNCVAHNGGKQRMQLIDVNGCVVNERFISPFRGTYNDNDLRHVTLYAYLKAFRFTGSPVLYLECEIHMCQSACPPQMCYWRRLSKRSVDNSDFEYTDQRSGNSSFANGTAEQPVISDSLSLFKALQVRHEPTEPARARQRAQALQEIYAEDDEAQLVCYRHAEVFVFLATLGSLFLLVLSVAITCFFRLRTLSERHYKQFEHSRLGAGSLSPSLLSISEPLSSGGAGSVLSFGPSSCEGAPAKRQHANRGAVSPQQIASRGQQHFSFNLSQPLHSPDSFGAYSR